MAKAPDKKSVEKRPVGRPSSYKPEYCDIVIAYGREGCSPAEIASRLDIDRTTLYDWGNHHEDFSTALKKAKTHEQEWWEKQGKIGLTSGKFNATVWTKSMQARFREDYTERTEITGKDGSAIEMKTTYLLDVSDLDIEELDVLEVALLNTLGKSSGAD